ncbi:MLX-interacting protein isoform X3 [Zophobas morio]|uniref:MLX-interacting protein isoform X3 n=1 Tax=Zophobas morio TaxID=2755281 RepID=UPI00308336D1
MCQVISVVIYGKVYNIQCDVSYLTNDPSNQSLIFLCLITTSRVVTRVRRCPQPSAILYLYLRKMHAIQPLETQVKREREAIHSGQFMVSTFEAEEQDDEDEVAVPIPEESEDNSSIVPVKQFINQDFNNRNQQQQLSIDTSLAKLFQCMSLAYRQKLTSPKWNRFRGIRLRWKDKIRLNNVIWRCWHLQFIKKENTLICQFASPLDVDTHNKPEAVVLEGKYWKRKLAAVTAEYKKWRMFYRNHALGQSVKDDVEMLSDVDLLTWNSQSSENMHMMVDEDYMGLMSDTLFSTITNQPFVFPDSREIAKAGLADFIQPSLGPLQPNLDDYMDTFEPLQEFMTCKLPTVPEEQAQNAAWNYSELDLISSGSNLQVNALQNATPVVSQYQQAMNLQQMPLEKIENRSSSEQNLYNSMMQPAVNQFVPQQVQPPSYHSSVISKNAKSHKNVSPTHVKINQASVYTKSPSIYSSYSEQNMQNTMCLNERIQNEFSTAVPLQEHIQQQQLQQQQQQQIVSQQQQQIVSQQQQQQMVSQQQTQIVSSQQQLVTQQQDLQQFKLTHQSPDQRPSAGYKFTTPAVPNIKFTSQVPRMMHPIHSAHSQYNTSHSFPKEEKPEVRMRGAHRGRQRSRSNTREPIRRPPLISAVSDPSLLTQLLTGSGDNESGYSRSQALISAHDQISKQVRIKEESSPIPILPQPPPAPTTLIITTPVTINAIQSSPSDPLLLNSFSSSNSPVLDGSQSVNSPTSSQGSMGSPNRDNPHRDQRRVGHIHAEQKRRYNIKNGFDMIHSLIPHLNQNPNAKLSKAAMLQKGAEYIRQLRSERNQLNEEMECLRQQIETLNTSISNCQSMLPATGAPVSRRRDSKMQEMFDDYVRKRTMENWKYWIFSLLFRPLLDSFNNFVSTSSLDDLYRSTILWIEQHCTLVDLRPVVLNSLKYLSTKTEILTEPEKLPDEVRQMVLSKNPQ